MCGKLDVYIGKNRHKKIEQQNGVFLASINTAFVYGSRLSSLHSLEATITMKARLLAGCPELKQTQSIMGYAVLKSRQCMYL